MRRESAWRPPRSASRSVCVCLTCVRRMTPREGGGFSSSAEEEKAPEGCLSIPDMEDVVTRPSRVTVRGLDPTGKAIEVEAEGLLARALQHEIDHLDGVLFVDRLSPFKRRSLLKKWKKSQKDGAKG